MVTYFNLMLSLTQRSGGSFKLVSVPSISLPPYFEDFLFSWHGLRPLDFFVLCLIAGKDVTHLCLQTWNYTTYFMKQILAYTQSLFHTV